MTICQIIFVTNSKLSASLVVSFGCETALSSWKAFYKLLSWQNVDFIFLLLMIIVRFNDMKKKTVSDDDTVELQFMSKWSLLLTMVFIMCDNPLALITCFNTIDSDDCNFLRWKKNAMNNTRIWRLRFVMIFWYHQSSVVRQSLLWGVPFDKKLAYRLLSCHNTLQ